MLTVHCVYSPAYCEQCALSTHLHIVASIPRKVYTRFREDSQNGTLNEKQNGNYVLQIIRAGQWARINCLPRHRQPVNWFISTRVNRQTIFTPHRGLASTSQFFSTQQ